MRRSQTRYRKRKYKRTRKVRGGNPKKSFSFWNKYHYGDNILNLKFLYNISDILKAKGINIKYYYDDGYNKNKAELDRYIHPNGVVSLYSIKDKPADAIELWMGDPINNIESKVLDKYYKLFYTKILNILNLRNEKIDVSLYQPEPYLQDIYNKLDSKFKDLDILIINAAPKSAQFIYDEKAFNEMCIMLSKKYKVATTSPVNDSITCTMRDGLMLQDIGAISTHAKYIIGIHSGPVTTCFNNTTTSSVKKWILFADNHTTHEEINCIVISGKYDYNKIEKNMN